MPRAGKMKECSRRPRETDHVSTTCGEAQQVRAKPQGDVYGLTPARCWKVKRGDVPWGGVVSGGAAFVVDVGEPSCDGQ